jgi:hypothetical protein
MKIAIASVGIGYFALRGIGSATGWALEQLRPVVTSAVGHSPETVQLQKRLGRAITLVREGRVDGAVVLETLVWLPGALLDGRLDASEVDTLGASLERVIGPAVEPTPSSDTKG